MITLTIFWVCVNERTLIQKEDVLDLELYSLHSHYSNCEKVYDTEWTLSSKDCFVNQVSMTKYFLGCWLYHHEKWVIVCSEKHDIFASDMINNKGQD